MLASCFVEKVLKCNHAELSLEQNPVATNQAVTRPPSRKFWARSSWALNWAPHPDSYCSGARCSLRAASEIAKYFAWPFNLQINWFLNNGKCYLFIYDISECLLAGRARRRGKYSLRHQTLRVLFLTVPPQHAFPGCRAQRHWCVDTYLPTLSKSVTLYYLHKRSTLTLFHASVCACIYVHIYMCMCVYKI